MSRNRKENPVASKTNTPEKSADSKKRTAIKWFIFSLLIAAIPFSMGKYIEFSTLDPFDGGCNVYSAKRVLDGAVIGVDELPSAQLGTLLVNMLGVAVFGYNEYGPEIIQLILQAGALIAMLLTMKKLFGQAAATLGVIIASTFLCSPAIAKFGNVKEQFMIAFMILGVCCFVRRQLGRAWWWSLAAGAFLAWAPIFKQTGMSAIGAVGLFVIVQPFLKNRTFRQTVSDIGLLFGGAVLSIAPIYIWLIIWHKGNGLPYMWLWQMLGVIKPAAAAEGSDYVGGARKMISFVEVSARIMRYYLLLILPITMAIVSILVRLWRAGREMIKAKNFQKNDFDRFVLLFAVWWILDMAFVWVSPRSFEQYYLPLNASAAMLGGYAAAIYLRKYKQAVFKGRWFAVGIFSVIAMIAMSWHIFAGVNYSPHSGTRYPRPQRGYFTRLQEISEQKRASAVSPWEELSDFIRRNSEPKDRIYVWGWYPGIYVKSQRISSARIAVTSEMHVMSPQVLSEFIKQMLDDFAKHRPLYIVDSRKRDFPWNRPPLELWPVSPKGLLPNQPELVAGYEQQYKKMLSDKIGEDEAGRFDSMKPLRDYVMNNYEPVRAFGEQILFRLKSENNE